jgi:hypothetical protein
MQPNPLGDISRAERSGSAGGLPAAQARLDRELLDRQADAHMDGRLLTDEDVADLFPEPTIRELYDEIQALNRALWRELREMGGGDARP